MSSFSSQLHVNEENSGCESDSDFEKRPRQNGKTKNPKKCKTHQKHQNNPVKMSSNEPTDDETESQLNFEETPVNSTSLSSPVSIHNQDKMRRRLQFFFMNPIEKWQAKRRWALKWSKHSTAPWKSMEFSHCRFPYKFVVQVIKIVLVTLQLCLFAHSRYNHVNYSWDNRVTFSHLFLMGWSPEMEVK